MAKTKVKNKFLKIVCFMIFVVLLIYIISEIRKKYNEFLIEKDKESKSVLLPFKIRRENFYITDPLYVPSQEKSNVIIKKNGVGLTIEKIVETDNNAQIATKAAITVVDEKEQSVKENEILDVVNSGTKTSNSESEENKNITNIIKENEKKNIVKKDDEKEKKSDIKEVVTQSNKVVDEKSKIKKSYYIQLGIFGDMNNVNKIKKELSNYNLTLTEDILNDKKVYRVTIEGFENLDSANKTVEEIKSKLNPEKAPLVRVRY